MVPSGRSGESVVDRRVSDGSAATTKFLRVFSSLIL